MQVAHNIANDFYHSRGFRVLPYLERDHPRCVYFPGLAYGSIPKFWKRAAEPQEIMRDDHDSLTRLLLPLLTHERVKYEKLENEWRKNEKMFLTTLNMLMPELLVGIDRVVLYPTTYGTQGTGMSSWSRQRGVVHAYVRVDAGVSHVASAILTDVLQVRYMIESDEYAWREVEAIIDHMLTHTVLADQFPDYSPTLSRHDIQHGSLDQASKAYLHRLGLRSSSHIFSLVGDSVLAHGHKLSSLTAMEQQALKMLVMHRGQVVTFEELGDRIWGAEVYDKYSLEAMAKLMQRTREKLEKAGVFPDVVQTVKKQGYMIND